MAGDWIKMRTDLAHDPAVIGIAAALEIDEDTVVGKLHRLWAWANLQTRDGNAPSVTSSWVDRYLCAPGFAQAMAAVGWLTITELGITIPHFDRHNGTGGKQRALMANRVERCRGKTRNAVSVTTALPEKRREEKKGEESPNPSCPEPPKPADSGQQPTLLDLHSTPTVGAVDTATGVDDPAVLEFPTVGKQPGPWPLRQGKLREYQEAFPGLDVLAESRKALQWCRDNPGRRKTVRGMAAFLWRWLATANDRGRGGSVAIRPGESREQRVQRIQRERAEREAGVPPPDDVAKAAELLRQTRAGIGLLPAEREGVNGSH